MIYNYKIVRLFVEKMSRMLHHKIRESSRRDIVVSDNGRSNCRQNTIIIDCIVQRPSVNIYNP